MKNLEAVRPSCSIDIIQSGENLALKAKKSNARKRVVKFVDGNRCARCGYLSSNNICKACMLLEGLEKSRAQVAIENDTSADGAALKLRALEKLSF